LSRLKTSIEMDVPVALFDPTVNRVRELPLRLRDQCALPFPCIAHGEHIPRILWIGHRILAAADDAEDEMAKRNLVHNLRRHQVAAQQAMDRLSIFFGNGRVETQCALASGIPLPSQRNNAVTIAQQPCITGITSSVPVPPIDQANYASPAAVWVLQQQRTIALAGIFWAQRHEIRGELDLTIFEVYRVLQIDDA